MKILLSIAAIIPVFFISSLAFAGLTLTKVEVEVGRSNGANLDPKLQGIPTFYQISGEVIRYTLVYGVSCLKEDAEILKVEVAPQGSLFYIFETKEQNYALVVLPIGTKEFDIRIHYRPLRAGLMPLLVYHRGERFYTAKTWIKVSPLRLAPTAPANATRITTWGRMKHR